MRPRLQVDQIKVTECSVGYWQCLTPAASVIMMSSCASSVPLLVLLTIIFRVIDPCSAQSMRWPPKGAKEKQYYIQKDYQTNWHAAYIACVENNSRLATIENEEQNARVLQMVQNSGVSNPQFWLGGTDLAETGRWKWLLTNKPVSFTNWLSGEPNNQDNTEHCMTFAPDKPVNEPHTFNWNDNTCSKSFYFICEYYRTDSILDDCDWKLG